jgi:uncharacterized NAD-dependent epimerase/dehydratase family protein
MNARVIGDLAELFPVGTMIEKVVADTATAVVTAAQVQAAKDAGARYALVQAQGGSMTYTLDGGTDPVATGPGFLMVVDADPILLKVDTLARLKGIRDTATSTDLQIQFMG